MRDPRSWFTTTFILTKVLLDESGAEDRDREAIGTLTMFGDTLQRRIDGGDAEVIIICKSEAERIDAIRKWFGIVLDTDQQEAIQGNAAEIKEEAA
jgi:hypothetical protein